MLVLAVLGLFLLVIMGVLMQTSVATNVTAQQRAQTQTNRAGEGALEVAANDLRRQSAAAVNAADDACGPIELSNDAFPVSDIEGRDVQVYCSVPDPEETGEYPVLLPTETDIGRTQLVGNSASGRNYPTRTDATAASRLAQWDEVCPGSGLTTVQTGCVPWRDSLDRAWRDDAGFAGFGNSLSTTLLREQRPNLIHSGNGTLEFGGDVEVRGTSVASLNPATEGGPAINVAGEFRQGGTGIYRFYSGGTTSLWSGDRECGAFSSTWGVSSGASWRAPQPRAAITDISGQPECNNAAAQNLRDLPEPSNAAASNVALPAPAPWSTAAFGASWPTVPTCATGVTSVQPGVYPPASMTTLNALIASCNSTLHFQPGDYWFATDLVISNANALVVFGQQNGWSPPAGATAANFPEACNPNVDGVTITLRDNASLVHTNGRVAICNRTNGNDTALYQSAQTPSEWIPASATVSSVGAGNWTGANAADGANGTWSSAPSVANLAAVDSSRATWSNPCSVQWLIIYDCDARAGAELVMPATAPSSDNALTSLTMKVVADTNDLLTGFDYLGSATINIGNDVSTGDVAGIRISARRAGASDPWCRRNYQGLPRWGGAAVQPLAYDLLAPSNITTEQTAVNTCWRQQFRTQADLQSAVFRVDFLYRARFVDLNPLNWFSSTTRNVSLTLDQLQVQAGWAVNGTASSNGHAGILERGGGAIAASHRCAAFNCNISGTAPSVSATASNFSGSTASYLPRHGRPDNIFVEVTGENRQASEPGQAWTRVTVSVPNRGSCTVTVPHIPTFGQTFQIPLVTGSTGPCVSQFTDALDMTRASVTVEGRMDCYQPAFLRGCFRALGLGVGNISMSIDHVRLVATTTRDDSRRTPLTTRMNATPSGAGSSLFIDGDVSVPRRDFEINWAGPTQSQPLVRGNLVLNGLASVSTSNSAEVGVVCCTTLRPSQRRVDLTAVVNDTVVSRSRIAITDVNSAGEFLPGVDFAVEAFNTCRTPVPTGSDRDDIVDLDCRTSV